MLAPLYERLYKALESLGTRAAQKLAQTWRDREKPPEGAIWRGFKDTRTAAGHWLIRIVAAVITVGFAVWGALLPEKASGGERAALAVAGTVGGILVVGCIAFAALVAAAPIRQRNDARGELAKLAAPSPGSPRPDEPNAEDVELIATLRTLCGDIDAFIESEQSLEVHYEGYQAREFIERYEASRLRTRMYLISRVLADRGHLEDVNADRLGEPPLNPDQLERKRDELWHLVQLLGGPQV